MTALQPHSWHSPEYTARIRSAEWQAFKKQIICQRGYQCEACRCKTNIELHHRHYRTIGHERPRDVNLLCKRDNNRVELALKTGQFRNREQATDYVIRTERRRRLLAKLPIIGILWR